MTKKVKVSFFFRPTVLLDHAASRLVKTLSPRYCGYSKYYFAEVTNIFFQIKIGWGSPESKHSNQIGS